MFTFSLSPNYSAAFSRFIAIFSLVLITCTLHVAKFTEASPIECSVNPY